MLTAHAIPSQRRPADTSPSFAKVVHKSINRSRTRVARHVRNILCVSRVLLCYYSGIQSSEGPSVEGKQIGPKDHGLLVGMLHMTCPARLRFRCAKPCDVAMTHDILNQLAAERWLQVLGNLGIYNYIKCPTQVKWQAQVVVRQPFCRDASFQSSLHTCCHALNGVDARSSMKESHSEESTSASQLKYAWDSSFFTTSCHSCQAQNAGDIGTHKLAAHLVTFVVIPRIDIPKIKNLEGPWTTLLPPPSRTLLHC